MFETFHTTTGVSNALGSQAQEGGCCVACKRVRVTVYPWPMPGLGMRCAVCIVKESQDTDA